MKDKLILVDVDGVLLDWSNAFNAWMEDNGYTAEDQLHTYDIAAVYGISQEERMNCVRTFNESNAIGWLEPHKDAVEYIPKIHDEHGYKFEVISSMSESKIARDRRINNLNNVFGDVFSDYIFLDTAACKQDVLNKYKDSGCFWIEDKEENAQAGLNAGLTSLIMKHNFNRSSTVAPIVDDWKQFYEQYIL